MDRQLHHRLRILPCTGYKNDRKWHNRRWGVCDIVVMATVCDQKGKEKDGFS